MKTKSKLFASLLICCALVLAFTTCAGCVASDSISDNNQPAVIDQPEVNVTTPINKVTAADIAGIWYSTSRVKDSASRVKKYISTVKDVDDSALVKLEINSDGTGGETWYTIKNGKITPYFYNTFRLLEVKKNKGTQSENEGAFTVIYDSPLSSYRGSLTGNSEALKESPDDVVFLKSPSKDYWFGYKESTYPTPEITKEHHPADYIEDGNYYLEDDNGRSFTDTLWTGDIAPYLAEYKNLPKMSVGGSQAGEWVKYVRGLSQNHHAYEKLNTTLYQTVDETINRGYGTCDDLAILAARGLKELGYNVSILVFPNHMDVGVAEEDYNYFHNYLSNGRYSLFHTVNNKFGDYYYLDSTDYQHNLDIGEIVNDDGFAYDMTLKKIIPL